MFHVGLSGYSYRPWQGEGRFYPPELKAREFFGYYAERYRTVEMDGTWYKVPSEKMVSAWVADAPRPFTFCPKMHRDVTHTARLKDTGFDKGKFFLKRLKPAAEGGVLGPILVQLPPNFKIQLARLEEFLAMLPKHSGQMDAEAVAETGVPLRYAFEFRNDTWNVSEVEDLLRSYGMAWVASETDEAEAVRRHSADFLYVRLRKTDYSPDDLAAWSDYFKAHAEKEQFVFCKHEDDSSPWLWANELLRLMAF